MGVLGCVNVKYRPTVMRANEYTEHAIYVERGVFASHKNKNSLLSFAEMLLV